MTDELDRLWRLHGLDEEVAILGTRLAELPETKRRLEQALATERARLETNTTSIATLQKQRREVEREIENVSAQEKKFLGQQAAVKTNAEYQALTHEIATTRAKQSELETRVLVLMEDEEKKAAERPAIDKSLAAATAELAERSKAIEAEEASLRKALDVLQARRDAAMAGLPAATRSRYERGHSVRGGRAVVPISKGACGGCYRAQPPQVMMEARKRDRLLQCDGCGRILVLPPDAEA